MQKISDTTTLAQQKINYLTQKQNHMGLLRKIMVLIALFSIIFISLLVVGLISTTG